jgi:tRNA-Thr(GGU) m(6)t(6)A37 methyltransferase TsaA
MTMPPDATPKNAAFERAMPTSMVLTPIGVVRSPISDRQAMPTFGVPARVEIFPEFADGLRHIRKHTHVWILAWLHEADRTRLLVTPRGVSDQSEAGLHGVFAVRSPTRPNPIAMTAARIERIEGTSLYLDRLDLVDGTPVVDVKPYFRSRDAIYAARNEQIGRPADRPALLESLLLQAENFHGERCGGLALGARLVEHFRSTFLEFAEAWGTHAIVPEDAGCLIDAVMTLVGATPGRGTLAFQSAPFVRFIRGDRIYTYVLLEPGRRWSRWTDLSVEEVLAAPDEELFRASSTLARVT